jgi:hypothetical protein
MKLSLHDAASRLGIHPAEFALEIATLTEALEDFWPEVDEGTVKTIEVLRDQRLGKHPAWRHDPDAAAVTTSEVGTDYRLPVSESAGRVVEKLWRKNRWGKLSVSFDTLNKHYHVENLDQAVEELVNKGLLIRDRGNAYALNTQYKGEIDAIAEYMIKHPYQR